MKTFLTNQRHSSTYCDVVMRFLTKHLIKQLHKFCSSVQLELEHKKRQQKLAVKCALWQFMVRYK